jgi:hypothetical protein
MSENIDNTNKNTTSVNENNNTDNPQVPENPGFFGRIKGLPWKKVGIYSAGTALVVVGGVFAYNGLMEKVVEVATEAAEKVVENAGKVAETAAEAIDAIA